MIKNNKSSLHIVSFMIIILGMAASLAGLLYSTGGKAFDFINQYGDKVRIYGDGLYAHDSYLLAPVFRGTDFTIICLAVPLLIIALVLDIRKKTLKTRLFLTSVIPVFTYYSASIAFGVTYNILHLVYIALFSTSLFGLIISIGSMNQKQVAESILRRLPYKGLYIFLAMTGVALIVAWLPDILSSLASGHTLKSIEVYTTSVTNVLDMGVIGPASLICLFLLRKRRGMGYILLGMLLTVCVIVGVMLPLQTLFQSLAGIELPIQVAVTQVGSFVVLALFALYFNIRFLKSIDSSAKPSIDSITL